MPKRCRTQVSPAEKMTISGLLAARAIFLKHFDDSPSRQKVIAEIEAELKKRGQFPQVEKVRMLDGESI